MKVINPKVEIIPRMPPLKKIELCGRECYKSEDKITEDSAEKFVRKLVEREHTSVLEHARVIVTARAIVPKCMCYGVLDRITYVPGINQIAVNGRDLLKINGSVDELANSPEADDYMSVRFTCDRAIANELVRHRVFSFSQCSTRYVNLKGGIEVIAPIPFSWAPDDYDSFRVAAADPRYQAWFFSCEYAERSYHTLIEEGCTPQEARTVLPMSTKTELIMTGTYPQWKEMLKLRMAKAAHPQMRYLMKLLVENPDFPNDKIKVEVTYDNP